MPRALSIGLFSLAVAFGAVGFQPTIVQAQVSPPPSQPAPSTTPANPSSYKPDTKTYGAIMTYIMGLFAWLLGVAVIVLDNAVYYTVIKMGLFVGSGEGIGGAATTSGLAAIGVTWRILRDLSNIILIFGFIAVGITTILNVDMYGSATKMIPKLIIAAIFVNFSLFIAGAIISVGNLFATQFYAQINGGQIPTEARTLSGTASGILDNSAVHREGISNKIMGQLGLQSIYGDVRKNPESLLNDDTPWYVGFMGIILFLVAAFVMFSLAFILIARFVVLVFLIIIAPVGFIAFAVPKLEEYGKQWWHWLIQQTLTAPILLLLLYVALAVITDNQFLTAFGVSNGTSQGCWTGFTTANQLGCFAGVMLSFLIAMGLLLVVTIAAKSLSAFGASWATGLAGKASFGLTAYGLRNTVGAGSNRAAKYLRSTRFATIPLVGTGTVRGLEKLTKTNFDFRGIKPLKTAGIDAGEAHKGGYADDLKKSVESRTKYAEGLKGADLDMGQKIQEAELTNQLNLRKAALKNAMAARNVAAAEAAEREVKRLEGMIDEFHKQAGTERGNKTRYADALSKLVLPANVEAGKKIKEEARKSKDDKDIDKLRKLLNNAAAAGGGAPAGGAPAGGAGAGGGAGGAAPAGGGGGHP